MDILMLILTEIILGYLLQSTTCILWLYVFDVNKINVKLFTILSLILTAIMYVVRLLPIRFGIHTLLSIIAIVLIGIWIFKFNVYKAAIAGLSATVILIICEIATYYIFISTVGKEEFDRINTSTEYIKYVPGDVGSIIYFLIVISALIFMRCRRKRISKN